MRKNAKKYLYAVQKSVFEGYLTQARLRKMQGEIKNKIDIEQDSVIIYVMENNSMVRKESIGRAKEIANDIL